MGGRSGNELAPKRILPIAGLALLPVIAFAQISTVPYASDSDGPGPTYVSLKQDSAFPGTYSSIRAVDFRNLRVPVFDAAGMLTETFAFKNGHYRYDSPYGHYSEQLDSVCYLSISSLRQGRAALVLYSWSSVGGSSSQGQTARVFTVWAGRLRLVQQVHWDTHFQTHEPTATFNPTMKTLVIRSAHYIPGDAHCCVSAVDVVTFRWDGAAFVQSGINTELSEYGQAEGRALPKAIPR